MKTQARRALEKYEKTLVSALRVTPLHAADWASAIPCEAGVYVIWEKKKPIYVGQTSSLSARMADLARPINHTFSKKTCHDLGLAETSLKEFSSAVSSKYKLSFVPVPLGRAELEEYLVLRWRKSLINKPAARLLKSPQYSWVVAVQRFS